MVELVTQVSEIPASSVDTRLGSFQQRTGTGLGASVDGFNAGLKTVLSNPALTDGPQIDDTLFNKLADIDPAALKGLQDTFRKTDALNSQGGTNRGLANTRRLSAVRKYLGEGGSPDVLVETLTKFNSSIGAFERLAAELPPVGAKQGPTELESLFSEADELNIRVFDEGGRRNIENIRVDVVAARSTQISIDSAEAELKAAETAETLDTLSVKRIVREKWMPARVEQLHSEVETVLLTPGTNLPLILERGHPDEGKIDPNPKDPAQLVALENARLAIDDIELNFNHDTRKKLLFKATPQEVADSMIAGTTYLNQMRSVLDGSERIDTLKGVRDYGKTVAIDNFYRNNSSAVDIIPAITEIGAAISLLGIEGLEVGQNIAQFMAAPMVKGVIINAVGVMQLNGVDTVEEQKELFTFLSDYIQNPINNIQTRGVALRNLLPNVLKAGVDNANLYESMLNMIADSDEGAKLVVDSMDNLKAIQSANFIRAGFFNYRTAVQNTFTKDLKTALMSPAFRRSLTSEEQQDSSGLGGGFLGTPAQMEEPLLQFVDDNLFADTDVFLNMKSLDELDLTDNQKERVKFAFDELFKGYSDKISVMESIQQNWFTQREIRMFSKEAEDREDENSITVNVNDG